MLHFCYELSEWPQDKLKPIVAIHSILFRLPIVRDILEQFRCIEAKEEVIKYHLNQGKSVAVVTGGIEEMSHNGEETIKIVLKKRKGYARIAKECNVPIVPMFTLGENELFPNETFWLWQHVTNLIYKWTNIYVPMPSWRSMKQWAMILRKPLDEPIRTFTLGVIDTKQKEEIDIRKQCEKLYEVFLKEKGISGELLL